ncbi:hypothetical protein, partial [Paractinoplanes deccanensis]|uniref:hypothetical protein n=1 Tax=Paractinoplanes deccanensis TaxID=113561 RepID=UPI001940A104
RTHPAGRPPFLQPDGRPFSRAAPTARRPPIPSSPAAGWRPFPVFGARRLLRFRFLAAAL